MPHYSRMVEFLMNLSLSHSISHVSHLLQFTPLIVKFMDFTSDFSVKHKIICTINFWIASFTNQLENQVTSFPNKSVLCCLRVRIKEYWEFLVFLSLKLSDEFKFFLVHHLQFILKSCFFFWKCCQFEGYNVLQFLILLLLILLLSFELLQQSYLSLLMYL